MANTWLCIFSTKWYFQNYLSYRKNRLQCRIDGLIKWQKILVHVIKIWRKRKWLNWYSERLDNEIQELINSFAFRSRSVDFYFRLCALQFVGTGIGIYAFGVGFIVRTRSHFCLDFWFSLLLDILIDFAWKSL